MPLKILVADDEAAIVKVVSRLLQRAGHEVSTAGTAAEALDLIAEGEGVDVALVDDHMPGGGRTVLQALDRDPDFAGRMFLMSGAPPHEGEDLPPGAGHLQKPFQFETLVDLVEGR